MIMKFREEVEKEGAYQRIEGGLQRGRGGKKKTEANIEKKYVDRREGTKR